MRKKLKGELGEKLNWNLKISLLLSFLRTKQERGEFYFIFLFLLYHFFPQVPNTALNVPPHRFSQNLKNHYMERDSK